MSSPWIEGVRSVALNMPDLAAAERFYTEVWNLDVAHRTDSAIYLRGCGSDDYLLALHQGEGLPQIRHVTLRARSESALAAIAQRVEPAGGRIVQAAHPLTRDPAGGIGLKIRDPHGRIFQIVHGDSRREASVVKDRPVRITHIVLNSHAVDDTQKFLGDVLRFKLADRTVAIAFMNCNSDHHSLAVGIADNDALNHIAFVMPDADSVMRGGGRMKDAGFPIQWGPGRHGPGNNLFNYFIDPFGVVIEYTAEVEQVDDSYIARGPDDWKWPPGRVDQWGISPAPGPTLKEAQRRVFFAPT
jgi:catechol 2,3-dioxygenase-like lactoylglutathione lyase family enzyme